MKLTTAMAERETAPLPLKRSVGLERDRLAPNQEFSINLATEESSFTLALGGGTVNQGHRFEIENVGGNFVLRNLDLPIDSEVYLVALPDYPAVIYLGAGEGSQLHYNQHPGQKDIIDGESLPKMIYELGRELGPRGFGDVNHIEMNEAKVVLKAHLKIIKKDGIFILKDLDSKYGTWINRETKPERRLVATPELRKLFEAAIARKKEEIKAETPEKPQAPVSETLQGRPEVTASAKKTTDEKPSPLVFYQRLASAVPRTPEEEGQLKAAEENLWQKLGVEANPQIRRQFLQTWLAERKARLAKTHRPLDIRKLTLLIRRGSIPPEELTEPEKKVLGLL